MALRNWNTKEQTIDSWEELVQLESDQISNDQRMVYRGQRNAQWGLEPSLCREWGNIPGRETEVLEAEKAALAEFKKAAHLYLDARQIPKADQVMGWWAAMQHHGAPTRLLDWTRSLFVAAYFATEDASDMDGAIWCLNADRLKSEVGEDSEFYGFSDLASPTFNELIYRHNKTVIGVAEWGCPVERIVAQQGCFTFSTELAQPHDLTIYSMTSTLVLSKIIIPRELKPEILGRLLRISISARTLFPGLDGFARSMVDNIRAKHPDRMHPFW